MPEVKKSEPKAKNEYVLKDEIAAVREKHPDIVIDIGAGDPVRVPPVQLWPDDVSAAMVAEEPISGVRLLLADDYERFTAAGGTALLLLQIFQDAGGVDLGKLFTS